MYETRFTVSGDFSFPIDMLRFDQCFPASQEDVRAISQKDSIREVNLIQYHEGKTSRVTPARWRSFLWEVTTSTTRKV